MRFAQLVRKLRAEAGHSSARSFFRAYGGTRYFACTYKAYLNVEAGRSLPQPPLALRIASAFGLTGPGGASAEFVAAYLRERIGSDELSGLLLRALSGQAASQPDALFRRASELSFEHRKVPLSRSQAERITADAESYWAFTVLSNERAAWTAAALAGVLRMSEARLKRSLSGLTQAGLLRRDKAGAWFCPEIGGVFLYPRDKFYVPLYRKALTTQWEAMAKRRGQTVLDKALVLRSGEARLRGLFPSLAQGVYGAHIYALREKRADSAFFVLQASVRRLLPF